MSDFVDGGFCRRSFGTKKGVEGSRTISYFWMLVKRRFRSKINIFTIRTTASDLRLAGGWRVRILAVKNASSTEDLGAV